MRVADLMNDEPPTVSTSTQPGQRSEKGQYRRQSNGKTPASYETADAAVSALERQHGKRSALWTYHDANGDPVGVIVRWDKVGGKDVRPVARRGKQWTIGGMSKPRPLYGLPSLSATERVYITEGEKAADAARAIGLTATTSAHGALSPDKTDWSPLAGKQCVILPDHDEPGAKYAATVAAILAKLAPPTAVKVVELPDLPASGDIADWVDARPDADVAELRREVEDLADESEAIEFEQTQEGVERIYNPDTDRFETLGYSQSAASIERFQPFPTDALPSPIREFVEESAAAIGCDSSYIALPVLACLGRAIGNRRCIRLKRTWHEPAIIWGAMVGPSGSHKSPALGAATLPLRRKEAESFVSADEASHQYERDMATYEKSYAKWKRSKSDDPPPWKPDEPECNRYIVGDITVEALADRLARQDDGLLMIRDELAGWLDGMAQYKGGKGSDTGHWLAMWAAAPMTVDRKTGEKKMIHIPRAAVGIIGGIQPDILRRAIGREHLQDGLCARLLMVMPPPKLVKWSDATVDGATEAAVVDVYDKLLDLEPAGDPEGKPEPYALMMAPGAKALWVTYYDRHRAELVDLDEDLAAAWTKLEAYTARLALIFQLVRSVSVKASDLTIDAESMRAAISMSDWFGREARRVYGVLVESDNDRDRRRLIEWIERKGGSVTAREVQQGHRQYRTAKDAKSSLEELTKAGCGTWESTPPGRRGQPTRRFVLSTVSIAYGSTLKPKESGNTVDVDSADAPETQPDDDWGEL
jgi:hypothetical protein